MLATFIAKPSCCIEIKPSYHMYRENIYSCRCDNGIGFCAYIYCIYCAVIPIGQEHICVSDLLKN